MIRRVSWIVALVALVSMSSACADEGDNLPTLTVDETEAKLKAGRAQAMDNNPRDVFDAGHLPGAHWVDYKNVTAGDLPADKSVTLIFYCANEH